MSVRDITRVPPSEAGDDLSQRIEKGRKDDSEADRHCCRREQAARCVRQVVDAVETPGVRPGGTGRERARLVFGEAGMRRSAYSREKSDGKVIG